MSSLLSQLFEQHKSQYQSSPKKEDSIEQVETGGNSTPRKETRKRGRSSPFSNVDSGNDINYKSFKREVVEPEFPKDTEEEIDEVVKEEIALTENSENEKYDEKDSVIDRTLNNEFYKDYAKTTEAFYNSQNVGSEHQSYSKALDVLNSALCPRRSRSALATGNDRRLAGDFDDEEDIDYPSRSLRGRYQPRKKYFKKRTSSGENGISYRLETKEEVEDRVRRMEEYDKNNALRLRWKERTVDFHEEEDIGEVFLERARKILCKKLRAEEKGQRMKERNERNARRKEQRKKNLDALREIEENDSLSEDDEVIEQSQLLTQISQHDTTLKEEDKGPIDDPEKSSEKMDYWRLGYAMPEKTSISYDFNPSVQKLVQSGLEDALEADSKYLKDPHDIQDKMMLSYSSLMRPHNEHRSSSRFFFEQNKTLISNGKAPIRPGYRTVHTHQMMSMASRSLCSSGGSRSNDEISLENRYLRLLCLRCEDSATKHYFDSFVEDQGKNMLFYLQNTWDDPVTVARKLGILSCFEESPMKGNLFTNIKRRHQNIRSKIKKMHKIRSINWYHENNDHVDSDEEDTILRNDKTIPDVTTSDGVVDAMTIDTSMTFDKNLDFASLQVDRDAFISPNTLFSHIAGTIPPTPQLPLDPAAWLFGPVDRYSKFYHLTSKMDSSTYMIILSTLLKRVCRAKNSKNESVLRKTQKQILNLIEEFADVNENKFYLRYTNSIQDPLDSDIPIVEFYRGVAGYCNYMANGYVETNQPTPYIGLDDSQQDTGVSLIAEKIWEFCRLRIRRNALLRFPKLKIVFGVTLICRSVSPSASEILSRTTDNDDMCTPLNLFKQALEDMESKNYISANRNIDKKTILAVELEFTLHDASEFFQEAVALDPTNVDYQLWHIGCLASCLIISSGNKVSNSVHAYPSQLKNNLRIYKTNTHEVRPCLKKFKEVRVELSIAVQALLTLAKHQDSSKAHLALFSLLEWGQVVGLLAGNRINDSLDDINRLHAFHFGEWAQHEPATFLREYNTVPQNICMENMYAQILENNPGEIKNWRNFVQRLGPISKTRDHDWWGTNRCWWEDSLLHMNTTHAWGRSQMKADDRIEKSIIRQLRMVINKSSDLTDCPSTMNKNHWENRKRSKDHDINWLPAQESNMDHSHDKIDISTEERVRCYANKLPRRNKTISSDNATASLSETLTSPTRYHLSLQNLSSVAQEVKAYKIFLLSQLFGVDHPSVRNYIYDNLLCKCIYDESTETVVESCDEFRVLVWLNRMRINVEEIIKSF